MVKPKIWNILKSADRREKRIIDHRAKRKLWHFEINTGPYMQLEMSKSYFSHKFHWRPSKLFDNIGYHDKSKCRLEYRTKKLASST